MDKRDQDRSDSGSHGSRQPMRAPLSKEARCRLTARGRFDSTAAMARYCVDAADAAFDGEPLDTLKFVSTQDQNAIRLMDLEFRREVFAATMVPQQQLAEQKQKVIE